LIALISTDTADDQICEQRIAVSNSRTWMLPTSPSLKICGQTVLGTPEKLASGYDIPASEI